MKVINTKKEFVPFTNVYVVKEGKVLLLHRLESKKIWPDKLIGIGGKVEPGEDLFEAAKREFFEETGGSGLIGLKLKGTFSWEDETNQSGINYIFTADDIVGDFKVDSDEGKIGWYEIEKVLQDEKFAKHQKLYFQKIISEDFYCSHSVFSDHFNTGDIIEYTDNEDYYFKRKSS